MKELIDYYVFHGKLPWAEDKYYDAATLKKMLRNAGIEKTVISSYDYALRDDYSQIDQTLLDDLGSDQFFCSLAGINPERKNWRERLDFVLNKKSFIGAILHPWIHNYSLENDNVIKISASIPTFICSGIESIRMAPENLPVRIVTNEEITEFLRRRRSGYPVIILGLKYTDILEVAENSPNIEKEVFFDTANIDYGKISYNSDLPGCVFGTLSPRYLPQGTIRVLEHLAPDCQQKVFANSKRLYKLLQS